MDEFTDRENQTFLHRGIASDLFRAYMTMPIPTGSAIAGGPTGFGFMRPDQAAKIALDAADAFVQACAKRDH